VRGELPFYDDLVGVAALQVDLRSEDKRLSAPVSKLAEPNPYCIQRGRGLGRRAYGHTNLRASDKIDNEQDFKQTGRTSNTSPDTSQLRVPAHLRQ
jgi:hypothetical protein